MLSTLQANAKRLQQSSLLPCEKASPVSATNHTIKRGGSIDRRYLPCCCNVLLFQMAFAVSLFPRSTPPLPPMQGIAMTDRVLIALNHEHAEVHATSLHTSRTSAHCPLPPQLPFPKCSCRLPYPLMSKAVVNLLAIRYQRLQWSHYTVGCSPQMRI